VPDADSESFWAACGQQRLLLQRCPECAKAYFYPRRYSPCCWAEGEEFEASGTGFVYAYSVVHQNPIPPFCDLVPYVAAVVELDEGPRMTTNVIGCDPASVRTGMRVRVRFEAQPDGVTLPFFEPA
jgi:uncharacterized OB-fold protein